MNGWELAEILKGMTPDEMEFPVEIVLGCNERHVFEVSDVKADIDREIIRITPS